MVKITFQFSILCLLCWNTISTFQKLSPPLRESIYCKMTKARRMREIHDDENIYYCTSIREKNLAMELSSHLKHISRESPINLALYRITFIGRGHLKFESLSYGWPHKVKWLKLTEIKSTQIEDDAFLSKSFSELEHLKILDTPIDSLKPKTFNGLKKLRSLFLRGINLINIHKDVLATMPNLEEFEIDRCGPYKVLLDNFFGYTKMQHLVKIQIIDCFLKDTITEKTFTGLPSVSILLLNSGSMNKIAPKSFDSVLKTLDQLYLAHNRLTTLPKDLFKTDREILISLVGNPIRCDCQMDHLREFVQLADNIQFYGFICSTPEKYTGVELINSRSFCDETIDDSTTSVDLEDEREDQIEEIVFSAAESNFEPIESIESIESMIDIDLPNTPSPSKITFPGKIRKKKIYVACENSVSTQVKEMIELTKPTHKIGAMTRIENGELYIDGTLLSNDFKLIGFKHFQSNESDEMVFNKETACMTYFKGDEAENVKFKRKLEPNFLNRFCWMREESDTIFPLDCVTFQLGWNGEDAPHLGSEDIDLDPWIMVTDKSIMITVCVLFAIFAPVIGFFIAVMLAKLFSGKIRGKKPGLKRSVLKQRLTQRKVAILMERDAINRLRKTSRPAPSRTNHLVDQPLRRRFECNKLTKPVKPMCMDEPVKPMFMDEAISKNFYEDDAYGYISVLHAPPVPPRNHN